MEVQSKVKMHTQETKWGGVGGEGGVGWGGVGGEEGDGGEWSGGSRGE